MRWLEPKGDLKSKEEILKVLKTADWSPSLHWEFITDDFSEPSIYDCVHPSFELADPDILTS